MRRPLYVLGSVENYTPYYPMKLRTKFYHSFDTKYKLQMDEHFDS